MSGDSERYDDQPEPRRVRHKKRGTTYTVLGFARAQVSKASPLGGSFPATARLLCDDDALIVYHGEDGQLWVRFPDEFNDGRFEELSTGEEADA